MPLREKQRRVREERRYGYAVFETGRTARKRKPRTGLFALVLLLATLALAGFGAYYLLFSEAPKETNDRPSEQVATPSVEQEAPKDEVAKGKDAARAVPVPEDPTLYLTVPRLGLYDNTVRNDRSEEALGLGAIKLPVTGFPWQEGPPWDAPQTPDNSVSQLLQEIGCRVTSG